MLSQHPSYSQFTIQLLDLALPLAQFCLFGCDGLFHLLQPPAQGSNHLIFRFVGSTLWRRKPVPLFSFLLGVLGLLLLGGHLQTDAVIVQFTRVQLSKLLQDFDTWPLQVEQRHLKWWVRPPCSAPYREAFEGR